MTSPDNLYWQAAVDWVAIEHQIYEGPKFDTRQDDEMSTEDWTAAVIKYLDRARVLGLDNPLGRQAVGKSATTSIAFFETVIRTYGSVPVPGFPSGVVRGEFKIGG